MSSIRFPAEWEPQDVIWLAWPHNRDTWPGMTHSGDKNRCGERFTFQASRFDPIEPFFAAWTRLIAEDTPVNILGRPESRTARELESANIQWMDIPTNDCWIRDYGPTFVLVDRLTGGQELQVVDWRYNAWGGKYPPWELDDQAAERIARQADLPVIREEIHLEGGALETDGQGRLLTTASCLHTPTRNPNHSRSEIDRRLRQRLGVTEIVWLEAQLAGDDTDGHIDQLARFIDPENIVVASSDDSNDVNFAPLRNLADQLDRWSQQTNPRPTIHPLPLPPPRRIDGKRVPESYCNFLWLARKRLLVPTFDQPKSDERALSILRELAPGTDVIGIDCKDMIWGLGALHCASREQPAVPSRAAVPSRVVPRV